MMSNKVNRLNDHFYCATDPQQFVSMNYDYYDHSHYSHVSASGPRSAAEANHNEVDTSNYRQLPCRTFVSVGTCPYRERCVYIHDPRCMAKDAKTKTRKKNKEETCNDSLFWPTLAPEMLNRRSQLSQYYSVPPPQNDMYYFHDASLFSLWNHFVDFCQMNSSGKLDFTVTKDIINRCTLRPRLPTLIKLSQTVTIASNAPETDQEPVKQATVTSSSSSWYEQYLHPLNSGNDMQNVLHSFMDLGNSWKDMSSISLPIPSIYF